MRFFYFYGLQHKNSPSLCCFYCQVKICSFFPFTRQHCAVQTEIKKESHISEKWKKEGAIQVCRDGNKVNVWGNLSSAWCCAAIAGRKKGCTCRLPSRKCKWNAATAAINPSRLKSFYFQATWSQFILESILFINLKQKQILLQPFQTPSLTRAPFCLFIIHFLGLPSPSLSLPTPSALMYRPHTYFRKEKWGRRGGFTKEQLQWKLKDSLDDNNECKAQSLKRKKLYTYE